MKIIYILSCSALLLTGCQTTSSMKNSITFVVGPSQHGIDFVFKNNWPLCGNFYDHNGNMPVKRRTKYLTYDNTCKVNPDGYVPEQIVIEYAPWLTYEEQVEAGMGNSRTAFNLDNISLGKQPPLETLLAYDRKNEKKIQLAIDKLPTSAWKKVVLYPTQDVAKYKNQLPQGKGNKSRGKEIEYTISLKPDGTYTITTKLYWKVPYQTNWN